MIYSIYKATNIKNGKAYIGFTKCFKSRKRHHIWSSFKEDNPAFNYIFHRAIRKNGINSFEWEILYQSKDKTHTLKNMENYFITLYGTHISKNGYNVTLGGEGVFGVRTKISEERKEKLKKRFAGKNNPFYGKKHTAENLTKMRMANVGKIHSDESNAKRSVSCTRSKSKTWLITDPNGIETKIVNLKAFCAQNNLSSGSLRLTSIGLRRHYKGWTCKIFIE